MKRTYCRPKLLSDFSYIDPNGIIWLAKENSEIDGASIPTFAWTFIGSPFVGKYRKASVIHDIACEERARTWQSVHLAFYNAMRASGVNSAKAKMMYAAVYHRGPRWPTQKKRVPQNARINKEIAPNNTRKTADSPDNMTTYMPTEYEMELIKPEKMTLADAELKDLIRQIQRNEGQFTIETIKNFNQ